MPTLTLNSVFSNRPLHGLAYFSPPYTTHTQLNYEIIFSLFHSDAGYMAEILPIWCKFLFNQSVNQSISLTVVE